MSIQAKVNVRDQFIIKEEIMKALRLFGFFIVLSALIFTGCGGNGSSNNTTGTTMGSVEINITDAPAGGFDHVWITVEEVWFNASENAEHGESGWSKFPLEAPVTIDLLTLSSGAMQTVWDSLSLPAGTYRQIRIFLTDTDDELTASATAAGLIYNNQVDVSGGESYPLRVPGADNGIKLNGTFEVQEGETLRLVIDFDAGHDIVEVSQGNETEYILKPRLACFDLSNSGAIVGTIDSVSAAENESARFVFKAEHPGPEGRIFIVRRVTFLESDQTGRFVLYPVPAGAYDLVMRGINYETVIIKNVPVTAGTTPESGATIVPEITMTASAHPDYPVDATIISPTGAWVHFSQTIPGEGELPHEIRFRHFNPFTGRIDHFLLSVGPINVGTYDSSEVELTPVIPLEGDGGFTAVAGAPLHRPAGFLRVNPLNTVIHFGDLDIIPPISANTVSGMLTLPSTLEGSMDRGIVFAVHGGIVVHAVRADDIIAQGGEYVLGNLPGGSGEHPLPGARYTIQAVGWSSTDQTVHAASLPEMADLSEGNAEDVMLSMMSLP